MTITLIRKKITLTLASIAALLVLIHSIVLVIYFYINDEDQFDFIRLIDLDYEGNIPTLFSALLFLISGTLFWLISKDVRRRGQKYAAYWLGLACVFVFLGFDEGTRLHEEIGDLFENVVDAEGWLYFPWVIPYSILFGIAMIIYFRFYLTLDRRLQIRLFICAVVFLSGAIGVELFSAREADAHGTDSMTYSILYTIEESLEMAGLILLIDTLLYKIGLNPGKVTIEVE